MKTYSNVASPNPAFTNNLSFETTRPFGNLLTDYQGDHVIMEKAVGFKV